MKEKYSRFFWPSYSDLMTSLFFVMMVLFVLSIIILNREKGQYKADADKYKKIISLDSAISKLPKQYFKYDKASKRHRFKIDFRFKPNKHNIYTDIEGDGDYIREKLLFAGKEIYKLIKNLGNDSLDISYLLIIEGNTVNKALGAYQLSYERALSLVNFWRDNGIDFYRLKNCEIIIAGSGGYGKARYKKNYLNRKFSIQITPKFGKF